MKPSTRKSKSRSSGKAVAKYNGVALPKDASERRRMRNKLSAKAFRERKQDALNSARKEVEGCDAAINKLEMQLNDVSSYWGYIYSNYGLYYTAFLMVTIPFTTIVCRQEPKARRYSP